MAEFEHLKAPYSFKDFYSNYPEGYSIYEAILEWLEQFNGDIGIINEVLREWELVDSKIFEKADKTYVDSQDLLKADKTYVDSQDLLKADKTYVDSQDLLKADKTYVDSQDLLKADKTEVDALIDDINTHLADNPSDNVHGLAGKVIAESGSNANGNYIKFDDGTMVCYGFKPITSVTPVLASAPLYYCSATFNNFAQTFISTPIVTASVYSATDNRVVSCATGFGPSTTNPYGGNPLRVYVLGASAITFTISYIAIGKWK